jgi:hypothetical protein
VVFSITLRIYAKILFLFFLNLSSNFNRILITLRKFIGVIFSLDAD